MSIEEDQDIFTLARAKKGLLCHGHFVSIQRELCLIEENAQWADQVLAQLQLYKLELSFLIRFSHWAASCRRLKEANSLAEKKFCMIWGKEEMGGLTIRLSQIRGAYVTDWHPLAWELKQKLEESKLVIEEWCKHWQSDLKHVLHLENMCLEGNDLKQMCVLVDLRHIVAPVNHLWSVPSSISNLWALETFILRTMRKDEIRLPETIWEMKWLRHVKINRCKLIFPVGHEQEVYSKLENVESFSSPTLSTGKDLEKLLQRLPAVRKLSCRFKKSCDSLDKRMETLDFLNQIESLNLDYIGDKNPYEINFPSKLKKLKLMGFKLPWTAISHIGKLQHLEVLKLLWNSFTGPVWEMEEDVVFPSLKFLKLNGLNLVCWNAVPESFPCLEQLSVIGCDDLVEIPPCFGVILTLKRFEVHVCRKARSSSTEIVNEQMDLGNDNLDADIS